MKTALFTNFSIEPFTGYWDGKGKTFQPGQSVWMPDYLARHFAKHLANRELIRKGKERDTSPKFPEQNANFMEMFDQAYKPDETEELGSEGDSIDTLIDVANKNRAQGAKAPAGQRAEAEQPGPEKAEAGVQTVVPPDFDENPDEDSFEGKPKEQ